MSDAIADHFRPGPSRVTAHSAFTNRHKERSGFHDVAARHREWVYGMSDPLRPDLPRRNVLGYFGTAGNGKTTLLRDLQKTIENEGPSSATLFVDFHDTTSFGVEDLILRLRTMAGELGKPCIAFDFALGLYWSVVHPNLSLATYTRSNSLLHRASERVGLSDEVQRTVADVASAVTSSSAIAIAGSHLVQIVAKRLTKLVQVHHAILDCEVLPYFLDVDNIVSCLTYLPALLAWDLFKHNAGTLTVFIDSYEDVTNRGRQFERILQRICYLLPNVLFVIAGRNALDWHDDRLIGSLDYVGEPCWPDLARGIGFPESRLVEIDAFSPSDAEQYLRDRLRIGASPAIPAFARNQIVETSNGWPLYLDLAADCYQQHLIQEKKDAGAYDLPFHALVTRLISDLSMDERSILMAAALFDCFDESLVRASAGPVTYAAINTLLNRSFVIEDSSQPWPFSLHGAVRKAVRSDQSHWAEQDWQIAAERAFDELGHRASATQSRSELSECVAQGLRLSHEFRLQIDWLSRASRRLASEGGLEPVVTTSDAVASPAADFAALLSIISMRGTIPFQRWSDQLSQCGALDLSDVDLFWAHSLQADSLLSMGHHAAAESQYRAILGDPPDAPDLVSDVKTMYALLLLKRGAFFELTELVASESSIDANRLLGDVYRSNANWSQAVHYYSAGLREAEKSVNLGLSELFRAELALIDGWIGTSDPARWLKDEPNGLQPWTRAAQSLAMALFSADKDPARAQHFIAEAEDVASEFGFVEISLDALVARGFIAAVSSKDSELASTIQVFRDELDIREGYSHWLEVLDWWLGSPTGATATQWIEGSFTARLRWTDVVERRRASSEISSGR